MNTRDVSPLPIHVTLLSAHAACCTASTQCRWEREMSKSVVRIGVLRVDNALVDNVSVDIHSMIYAGIWVSIDWMRNGDDGYHPIFRF